MANSKISALPSATTPLAGTEVLPIVQSSATDQVTVANLTAGRAVSALSYTSTTGATFATTSGNVGIGVSPTYKLDVADNVNGIVLAQVRNNSNGSSGRACWLLGNDSNATAAGTWLNSSTNTAFGGANSLNISNGLNAPISFFTQGAEKMRLGGDSNLSFIVANKGINFTANTPAAGMTSQLLNWYEEGTWTPVATSSIGAITTYTSAGWYTKVGRTVTIYGYVTITAFGTGSGNLNISGLPFTTFNTTNQQVGVCRESAVTGKMGQLVVGASATSGFIQLYDGTLAVGGNWRWVFNMTYISAT